MADVGFNRKEIEDLARKLSTLQPFLSEKERALLLAIFAAAVSSAKVSSTGKEALEGAPPEAITANILGAGTDKPATLADLQQQLSNAYTPGGDIDSITLGGSTFKIIKPPVGSPPGPAPAPAPGPEQAPGKNE